MQPVVQPIVLENLAGIAEWQDRLSWQPFREGIEIYELYGNRQTGAAAALLRYQPGAAVPIHEHLGFEHIFVLSGSQSDQNGTYTAGTLLISPPQSQHHVNSTSGCIVLAIWEQPIALQ
jgi:anti-sigma factor ChrR (cupin superfamily)